ncbi:MAG: T9SS type A sorting domain-containing protein, partial [Ignavibacteriae bacterium]|nr:T9SS type A sorting domain-containing protein [Ignavibacteriota bacterium]
ITEMYGTTSTDGGTTFAPNSKISNGSFNPNNMAIGSGDAKYMGDYIGNSGIGITSYNAWMDNRTTSTQTRQSFVGYNPDFALTTNPSQTTLLNNDSTIITVKVPAIKGIYNDKVKFTYSLDSLPATGSIIIGFANGRDSITTFPDSIYLKVKTVGNITPARNYNLSIIGAGSNGTPVHKRIVNLLVNAYSITVQSNRNGICAYKVNGISYTNPQQFIFQVGSTINVQAVTPQIFGGVKYVFRNWSDNGDTTHNVTISGPLSLTVYYKPQYILILNSDYGTTIGGGQYYDSAVAFTFGVYPRIVKIGGGVAFQFHGWDGAGNGSYTSPDTLGFDTLKTIAISNPIVETARWTQIAVGINNISSEIPDKYVLYQNYPNPFNPNTNIKFAIKDFTFVSLKIYNILGKEVATLVNENLKAGIYEVPFSNNRISSGIYFYKISTDNFIEIKKMLLIK